MGLVKSPRGWKGGGQTRDLASGMSSFAPAAALSALAPRGTMTSTFASTARKDLGDSLGKSRARPGKLYAGIIQLVAVNKSGTNGKREEEEDFCG